MTEVKTCEKKGFVSLKHLGLLKIFGKDAHKLLQGQLTCDMNEVTSNHSLVGAHCNPQGRIISLFRIFHYQDSYFLQMPREMIPIALRALKKYAIFFKVELVDESDEWIAYGCSASELKTLSLPQKEDVFES